MNINRVMWDSDNHLYAISHNSNKLYVLNVSSSGVTQAPGSAFKSGCYPPPNPLVDYAGKIMAQAAWKSQRPA